MSHQGREQKSQRPEARFADLREGNAEKRRRQGLWFILVLDLTSGIFTAVVAFANPAQDRLAAMPEVERSEALAVFVESGGHRCRTVSRTFFQGEDAKGNVFWDVECTGGESYVVVIKNDVPGSTRVMTCRRLRAVAGADCFKKLE